MLRIGVIGVGAISEVYLPILRDMYEKVKIVTVMSRTQASYRRAQLRYSIPHGTNDFHEFSRLDLDCVFVLSPKDHHKEYVVPLLERGVHVYCEKPMASSLEDAESMAEAASRSSAKLMFAFNRRFMDVYAFAKKEFEGIAPTSMVCQKNRPGTEYRSTLENTLHVIDLMTWFCGKAKEVHARAVFEDPLYETEFGGLVEFESGALGVVSASRAGGAWQERVSIHGDGVTVEIDAPCEARSYRDGKMCGCSLIPVKTGFVDAKETMGFKAAVQHFIDCVESGEQPLANAEAVLESHRLLDKLLRTAGLPAL